MFKIMLIAGLLLAGCGSETKYKGPVKAGPTAAPSPSAVPMPNAPQRYRVPTEGGIQCVR
jgi:hypothetical protein